MKNRNTRKFSPSVAGLESLETRNLLSGIATDFVLQSKWASPAVTYSIVPDGTDWRGHPSTLEATMQAKIGPGWRDEIGRALQTWAAASGLTITQVADSGAPEGADGKAQGDSHFGDIRFGGYDLGSQAILAQTYGPSNGTTLGGDVVVNTSFNWNKNADIDLYSVMLHESGHAIGLGHASDPGDVMYPQYTGVVAGLGAGDIAGDQALYGPPEGQPAPPPPAPPVVVTPTPVPTPTPTPTPVPPVVAIPTPTPVPVPKPVPVPTPTPPVVVVPMTPAQRRAANRAAQQAARQARRQAQQQARIARQEARRAAIAARAVHHVRGQALPSLGGRTRHTGSGFTVTYRR